MKAQRETEKTSTEARTKILPQVVNATSTQCFVPNSFPGEVGDHEQESAGT